MSVRFCCGRMIALLPFALVDCSSGEDFARSCDGAAVTNCLPFEASVITAASVEPEELPVGDISVMARVRLEFDVCDQNPRPHEISVRLRPDEGEDTQLIDILTLRDDGSDGDSVASDGVIDVELVNPLIGPLIPPNENVFLRFQARSTRDCSSGMCVGGTCVSESFEVPYRTGRGDSRR